MSTFGDGVYQFGGVPVGSGGFPTMEMFAGARDKVFFVDGDNGSDGNNGKSPTQATKTIQKAIDLVSGAGAVIYVFPKAASALSSGDAVTGLDPTAYAETLIIANDTPHLSLIGVGTGLTLGGFPVIRKGSGTTALLDIRAPGCLVQNLCFNGASSTGGGISLTEVAATSTAWGTVIRNCMFKNCKVTHANSGGAIQVPYGGVWQVLVEGNRFFNCIAGVSIVSTSVSRPQDWVIRYNTFSSTVNTSVDCDLYMKGGGDGCEGLIIDRNVFATVEAPSHADGSTGRYMDLTGCEGIVSNNTFACHINATDDELTFGAAGTAALIPTTISVANNWGNSNTVGETAEVIHIA
jgi:hypothetical protein